MDKKNRVFTILPYFFHVLSAHYHYAKFHNDSLINNKKNKFANILIWTLFHGELLWSLVIRCPSSVVRQHLMFTL